MRGIMRFCLLVWLTVIQLVNLTMISNNNNSTTDVSSTRGQNFPKNTVSATRNTDIATISLGDNSILIDIGRIPTESKMRKLLFSSNISVPELTSCRTTKTISISATNLPHFIESLIFVNFFKTFAPFFLNGYKWQLLLDVFKVFFDAIQSWKDSKYFHYFRFFYVTKGKHGQKHYFISMTILILSYHLVSNHDQNATLQEFFELILNNYRMYSSLKQIINGILVPSQREQPIIENEMEIINSTNYGAQNYNYFNLATIGILSQLIIAIKKERFSRIYSNSDCNQVDEMKEFVYDKIIELWEPIGINPETKHILFKVNQVEFKERMMQILKQAATKKTTEDGNFQWSDVEVQTLISPLIEFIDHCNVNIFRFPVNSLNLKTIEICESFLKFIEGLVINDQQLCIQIVKCLENLKIFFSQFFLTYSSFLCYKSINEEPSRSLEILNNSMHFFTKIELISKIEQIIKYLKKPLSHNSNNTNEPSSEYSMQGFDNSYCLPIEVHHNDMSHTEKCQSNIYNQLDNTYNYPDPLGIIDNIFDPTLSIEEELDNIRKKSKPNECMQTTVFPTKISEIFNSNEKKNGNEMFTIDFVNDIKKDFKSLCKENFSMKCNMAFLKSIYEYLKVEVNIDDIFGAEAKRVTENYLICLPWELKNSSFNLVTDANPPFIVFTSPFQSSFLFNHSLFDCLNSDNTETNSKNECSTIQINQNTLKRKRESDSPKNSNLTEEEQKMIKKVEDDFNFINNC